MFGILILDCTASSGPLTGSDGGENTLRFWRNRNDRDGKFEGEDAEPMRLGLNVKFGTAL